VVAVEAPGPPEASGPYRELARAILRYQIFPPRLVTGILRRMPVEPGDTVGTCYHLARGVDLFFGSRVVECFDGPAGALWRTGFTYRTLVGHPVLGEETFSVEKDLATGRVEVALRSWSRPGILVARLLPPVVRLFQKHAVRAALDHLAGMVGAGRGQNAGGDCPPRTAAQRRGHSTFWLVRHV
jgi:hypothetical protein